MIAIKQLFPFGCLKSRMHPLVASLRTDSLAPSDLRRRIQRKLMLEEFVTAEVLPVGILQKTLHHRLITLIERVLQVVKPDHKSDRKTGATFVLHEQGAKLFFKGLPVDLVSQHKERMLVIQNPVKAGSVKIILSGINYLFWSHKSPAFEGLVSNFW